MSSASTFLIMRFCALPNRVFSIVYLSKTSDKRSLKIPKGLSEAVNRRTTDNTMAKKKDKRTNSDLQNIHINSLSNHYVLL
jgi:aminopeptidase-like protein